MGFGGNGAVMAGMGVDAADFDNDGQTDLVVTNFENEPISLYRNSGGGYFVDESVTSGLGTSARPYRSGASSSPISTGMVPWTCSWSTVTSMITPMRSSHRSATPSPAGSTETWDRTFADVSKSAGTFFSRREVARRGPSATMITMGTSTC